MRLNLVVTRSLAIEKQLQLEEALLRTNDENWCFINEGSATSIVLGSNNNPNEVIDYNHDAVKHLTILKRFSAGGTVVVDHNTLFVTFIFNAKAHNFNPFPEPILKWSSDFYSKALNVEGFGLKENDYTIHNKKVGGNAQYLKKDRWLHHTTFLYDYNPQLMLSLKYPPSSPKYRKDRAHKDFLTTLKPYIVDKNDFITSVRDGLSQEFDLNTITIQNLLSRKFQEHRKSTQVLSNSQIPSSQNTF